MNLITLSVSSVRLNCVAMNVIFSPESETDFL